MFCNTATVSATAMLILTAAAEIGEEVMAQPGAVEELHDNVGALAKTG